MKFKISKQNKARLIVLSCIFSTLIYIVGYSAYAISITTPQSITYIAQPGTTMQTFTPAMCSTMDTYSTLILNDPRGAGQNYRIRKMPDGRCWMIDDLKLGAALLTPADSNLSSNYNFTDYIDLGATSNADYYYLCAIKHRISPNSLTGCGYWYSFLGIINFDEYGLPTPGSDTQYSICPKGWRLPTGGTTSEFAILNNAMATGSIAPSNIGDSTTIPNWTHNGPFEGTMSGYSSMYINSNYFMHYPTSTIPENSSPDYYQFFNAEGSMYVGTGSGLFSISTPVRCILAN